MVAELKGPSMSVLDKLDRINEKHAEFEKALDEDAQRLLERYEEVQNKQAKVFERRNLALDERAAKIDAVDKALDRMSNLGNLPDFTTDLSVG